jgi:uncharacterized protein YegJ (DUF2314 family)
MRLRPSFPGLLLLPLLLAALPCAAQTPLRLNEGRDNVADVASDDAHMDAAMGRARATLPVFHGYLQRAGEKGIEVKLKVEFEQGEVVEHMWLRDVTFDGRVYRGVLESTPMELTNVAPGDAVTARPERVTDWMVAVDDVMLGNFTTMEIRRRLSAKERTRMDRMMGYRILADTAITAVPQRQ